MPECVIVRLEEPTDTSLGSVTEGYYVVQGSKLTMVFADGQPVLVDGVAVERELAPGDDARLVAGRLTKEIRRSLSGERVERFGRDIQYANMGVA